jgi:hypothetical protein
MGKYDMTKYQQTPAHPAQAGCPHRLRNRDNTECSTCASFKLGGKWWYLIEREFIWYTTGEYPKEVA